MSPLEWQAPIFRQLEHLRQTPIRPKNPLTADQREALAQLWTLEQAQQTIMDRPKKYGLVLSTGMGKTMVVSSFVDQLVTANHLPQDFKIVVVYENVAALEQLKRHFQQQMQIRPEQVLTLFGGRGPLTKQLKPENVATAKLILASRSSYFTNRILIHQAVAAMPQSTWIYLFDEAHHLGTDQGEFSKIFFGDQNSPGLQTILHGKDRIIMATATPWHLETNIIASYMDGLIAAPGLTAAERAILAQTSNIGEVQKLISLQLFRNMANANLAVPQSVLSHLHPDPQWAQALNESITRVMKVENFDQQVELLRKDIHIYQDVVDLIAQLIIDHQQTGVKDHGLILAPTIAHAEFYKVLLIKAVQQGRFQKKINGTISFEAYHSRLPRDKRELIEEKFIHAPNHFVHQYVIAVDAFREALDVRSINIVINTSPINSFQALVQIFGRPARIAAGKIGFRFLDLTSSINKLLAYAFPAAFPAGAKLSPPPLRANQVIEEAVRVKKTPLDVQDLQATELLPAFQAKMQDALPIRPVEEFQLSDEKIAHYTRVVILYDNPKRFYTPTFQNDFYQLLSKSSLSDKESDLLKKIILRRRYKNYNFLSFFMSTPYGARIWQEKVVNAIPNGQLDDHIVTVLNALDPKFFTSFGNNRGQILPHLVSYFHPQILNSVDKKLPALLLQKYFFKDTAHFDPDFLEKILPRITHQLPSLLAENEALKQQYYQMVINLCEEQQLTHTDQFSVTSKLIAGGITWDKDDPFFRIILDYLDHEVQQVIQSQNRELSEALLNFVKGINKPDYEDILKFLRGLQVYPTYSLSGNEFWSMYGLR